MWKRYKKRYSEELFVIGCTDRAAFDADAGAKEVIELSDLSKVSPAGRVSHYAPRSIGSAGGSGVSSTSGGHRKRRTRPDQGRNVENQPTII